MDLLNIQTFLSICLGIGLAASSGFRVFLPLFLLSVASHFGYGINQESSYSWVGGTPALIALGSASLIEIGAYFIPVVDNLLDHIAIPLAGIAGTFLMGSSIVDLSPVITWGLAIIAGGGTAATIKAASSSGRIASTVSTAGMGNFFLSLMETLASLGMYLIAIFIPVFALVIVMSLFVGLWKVYKWYKRAMSKI